MPTTHVTCEYDVNAAGNDVTDLATLIAAPPVDPATLQVTGCTIASDVTTPLATSVRRVITLNLTAAFKALYPIDGPGQAAPFFHFMQGQLEAAVGGPVLAQDPVVS